MPAVSGTSARHRAEVAHSAICRLLNAHREQLETEEETDENAYIPDCAPVPDTPRCLAARCVRVFLSSGWISEETLPDYTRIINTTTCARPIIDALARVDEGLSVE